MKCDRLFAPHQWGKWVDVTRPTPITRGDDPEPCGVVVRQERRCELCNRLEIRYARALA